MPLGEDKETLYFLHFQDYSSGTNWSTLEEVQTMAVNGEWQLLLMVMYDGLG